MSSTTIQSETTRINFVEYVGDTIPMYFQYKEGDETGPLVVISDYNVVLQVKRLLPSGEPDSVVLLQLSSSDGTIWKDDDTNIITQITSIESEGLGVGEYGYSIVLSHKYTGFVNTLIRGKIILKSR